MLLPRTVQRYLPLDARLEVALLAGVGSFGAAYSHVVDQVVPTPSSLARRARARAGTALALAKLEDDPVGAARGAVLLELARFESSASGAGRNVASRVAIRPRTSRMMSDGSSTWSGHAGQWTK